MAQTFWLLFTVSFLKIKTIPIYNHFVLYLQFLIELNSMKKYELQIIFMFLDVHNFCKSELRCSYQIRSYRKKSAFNCIVQNGNKNWSSFSSIY